MWWKEAMKLKKIGHATLHRRVFMGRKGVIYQSKKEAFRKADLYPYSIKVVVPVYVKESELKKALKEDKIQRNKKYEQLAELFKKEK